jgi:hypothetical protein
VRQYQLLDVGERDVGTGAGVIQAAIRVFLYQSALSGHFVPLRKYQFNTTAIITKTRPTPAAAGVASRYQQ